MQATLHALLAQRFNGAETTRDNGFGLGPCPAFDKCYLGDIRKVWSVRCKDNPTCFSRQDASKYYQIRFELNGSEFTGSCTLPFKSSRGALTARFKVLSKRVLDQAEEIMYPTFQNIRICRQWSVFGRCWAASESIVSMSRLA